MELNKYTKVDHKLHVPNFISFFTDEFSEIYGQYGTLLLIKIKPMRELNAKFGMAIGDHLLELVANYLKQNVKESFYRHEGNGFLIVYKESTDQKAKSVKKALSLLVSDWVKRYKYDPAYFYGLVMTYNEPILSVADYYKLFYEEYMEDFDLSDGKEMVHYIINGLSHRVHEMIHAYEDARTYALYDDISKLPNSKSANLFFEDIDEKYQEYAILFIDGDRLRRFNQVSYDYGNQAIKTMAEVIEGSIRKSDKLFRWLSGDEFVVVATDISKTDVAALAERIRKNVENHFRDNPIHATVSIGISSYPEKASSIKHVLTTAEQANKLAKAYGRNQVVFWDKGLMDCHIS